MPVMSIGFLIEEETPMIWRGPMVMSALTQMLREVEWGTLDVMVVDMPPGTGDAQLTMAQQVPLKGAVIVSTPQDLALIDARRGIAMFRRVNVPVLGIVENMSSFICPHCGTRSDIFGHGGARHEAERLGVPFLGEVPLDMAIREKSDAGLPVVATAPDGPHAQSAIATSPRACATACRRKPPGAEDRHRGVRLLPAGLALSADTYAGVAPQHLARQRAGVGRVLDHEGAVDDDGGACAARELVRIGVGGAIGKIVRIEDRRRRRESLPAAGRDL